LGGVVEIILRFQAAAPASHRPGLRPTRGSGFGTVAEITGVAGCGITAGGGVGGGGGGPPRPRPRPVAGASAGAAAGGAGVVVAGAAVVAGAGADCAAGGGAAGVVVAGAGGFAAGAGAAGVVAGAVFGPHATTSIPAAIDAKTNDLIDDSIRVTRRKTCKLTSRPVLPTPPTTCACARSRSFDRHTDPTRTCRRRRPAARQKTRKGRPPSSMRPRGA
jgi:hypothetical protein